MAQYCFECLTCWGPDSVFGVCRACGITCHQGHQLKLKHSELFVCDCGRYKHKTQLCTRQSTGFKRVQQPMYICYDFFDVYKYQNEKNGNILGVCYPCAMKCHNQHNIKFYQIAQNLYCDCGLSACKIKSCKTQ